MRKIIKLEGIRVDNDALPFVAATEEDRTLAAIPGLTFWLQAGPQFGLSATDFRERAQGRAVTAKRNDTAWSQGSFPGGAPALVGPSDGPSSSYDVGGARFELDRWSVAMAASISAGSVNNEVISYPDDLSSGGPLAPRLGFNSSNGFAVREGPATTRLSVDSSAWIDTPALIITTFSVQGGLSVRVNGSLEAHAEDYRPLELGEFHLGAGGLEQSSGGFGGRLGHLMVFNEDLSSVENTGYRRVLEQILMTKYGID